MEDQKPKCKKEMPSEQSKKQAQFWLEYGQQLSAAIRYTEALAAIERAISLDEMNAEAWYARGTCLAMLARYDEALESFEHALFLNKKYVPAWDGKAWALGIMGRREESLDAANRELVHDPENFKEQYRSK